MSLAASEIKNQRKGFPANRSPTVGSRLGGDAAPREAAQPAPQNPWEGLGLRSGAACWLCSPVSCCGPSRESGDAVKFVAIFWDVLASWSLDTSSPATLRQQQPPFLATCVCGVPREVLGAARCWCQAGCWLCWVPALQGCPSLRAGAA